MNWYLNDVVLVFIWVEYLILEVCKIGIMYKLCIMKWIKFEILILVLVYFLLIEFLRIVDFLVFLWFGFWDKWFVC